MNFGRLGPWEFPQLVWGYGHHSNLICINCKMRNLPRTKFAKIHYNTTSCSAVIKFCLICPRNISGLLKYAFKRNHSSKPSPELRLWHNILQIHVEESCLLWNAYLVQSNIPVQCIRHNPLWLTCHTIWDSTTTWARMHDDYATWIYALKVEW